MSQINESLPPDNGFGEGISNSPNSTPGIPAPPNVRGFNWGAFLLSWIWAIGNGVWIGLLGLIPCFFLPVGLLLGFKGNEWAWKAKKWSTVDDFRRVQRTWAIVGLAFLGFRVILLPIYAAILFPVFGRARENAKRSTCQTHMQRISVAVLEYAQAHDGHFPSGSSLEAWRPQLQTYLVNAEPDLYQCPAAAGVSSYQINPELPGHSIADFSNPASIPLLTEPPDSHLEGSNTAFLDSHVKWHKGSGYTGIG